MVMRVSRNLVMETMETSANLGTTVGMGATEALTSLSMEAMAEMELLRMLRQPASMFLSLLLLKLALLRPLRVTE
jgi:hypothetical protein